MRCHSQTGSMRSGEEVGGNRRNTKMLRWSPTASSVRDTVCLFRQAPLSCTYQPFKRGKQRQHGMLALLKEEEWVDILFHTHTKLTHAILTDVRGMKQAVSEQESKIKRTNSLSLVFPPTVLHCSHHRESVGFLFHFKPNL